MYHMMYYNNKRDIYDVIDSKTTIAELDNGINVSYTNGIYPGGQYCGFDKSKVTMRLFGAL